MFNSYVASKKEEIRDDLYEENIKAGKTPNNAVPTQSQIDNKFKIVYEEVDDNGEYTDGDYEKYNIMVSDIEDEVAKVEIIVKAFEQRQSMLISMGSLVKGMMDNNIHIKKKETFDEV